jgi:hypothetical protein
MSRSTRAGLRTAAPPLLALALVTVLVHPLTADSAQPPLPRTGGDAASREGAAPPSGAGRAASSGNVETSIPVVAFQEHMLVDHGRLRTAVLVNVSAPRGVASVAGEPTCQVEATPGIPAWLDCRVGLRAADEVTVRVELDDHRVFTRSLPTTSSCADGRRVNVVKCTSRRHVGDRN